MALTKLTTDLIEGDLGGGTTWVSDPKTASFTAVAGEGYFVNTTSAAITVTLPSSPTAGDEVSIVDYAGTADTNNITITSSDNINGSYNDVKIDYERGGVSMVYVDATQGWIAYNANNETAEALIDIPTIVTVDYLVVAGGGGGGGIGVSIFGGAGGGAGGLRTSYTNTSSLNGHNESSLTLDPATNYTVSVGPGGSYSASSRGANGTNSRFSSITSTGGGGGALGNDNATDKVGKDGGSGGGGGYQGGVGGSAVTSPVTQGHDGATNDASGTGGGGGGAGDAADNTPTVGDAGVGLAVNIINASNATTAGVGEVSGSDVYFAGGGGGGDKASETSTTFGTGGNGGGGNGASDFYTTVAEQGSNNTGGGGGGGSSEDLAGASGGSGVVIIRYPSSFSVTETTSPSVLTFNTYTEGSDKVTVFTAGENGTIQFS